MLICVESKKLVEDTKLSTIRENHPDADGDSSTMSLISKTK